MTPTEQINRNLRITIVCLAFAIVFQVLAIVITLHRRGVI